MKDVLLKEENVMYLGIDESYFYGLMITTGTWYEYIKKCYDIFGDNGRVYHQYKPEADEQAVGYRE